MDLLRQIKKQASHWGVTLSTNPVCEGHDCTAEIFAAMFVDRLSVMLVHGARGTGKSYGAALAAHFDSMCYPRHATNILGGSLAQSGQIYNALRDFAYKRSGPSPFSTFTKTRATYPNGSEIMMLAASETSVHGPHVPRLFIDEVDEVDNAIREAASGIPMEMNGIPASTVLLSTWHRIAGPMSGLIKKAKEGAFRLFTFCVFDVLERCPVERSGPNLEGCESCVLKPYCHEDRHLRADGLPKAKRSNGHYKISDLIDKFNLYSIRTLQSDFFCTRPRSSGVWFIDFDEKSHVSLEAEYNPNYNFHLAIDPGVHTGAVWFQAHDDYVGDVEVNVFGDYYSDTLAGGAEANAQAIIEKNVELTGVGLHWATVSIDPQSNQRTGVGPTMRGEYERIGCVGRGGRLRRWPSGTAHPKQDALALIEALLQTANGRVRLRIHPRCKNLIDAFMTYVRAIRDNEYMDYPKDPQHPQENLIDPLAGGLKLEYPQGRTPRPELHDVPVSAI
jgi:hypothetical protein